MSGTQLIARVCLPTLVVSSMLTVGLALTTIWMEHQPDLLERLLQSALVVALGSGFLLSATRVVGAERKRDA